MNLVSAEQLPRISWVGTGVFAITSVAAVLVDGLRPVAAGVALALFTIGTAAFLWSYAIAIGRSRTDAIGIGGLYFLAGETAPAAVRRSMMASLAVQTIVALATASARPFTSLAFGILVPVLGLGLAGLWGARYGTFSRRTAK
ncbi:MAG TPA: hypothetical protein VM345_18305 [Acidimicrobiales bacterium]|jgi:hypothetical protein|nr:hypothetical protein [Acidimicrobiales bacterium]